MQGSKVRVRYAPSPTGQLHIGNARSALFNYLFAKHFKGSFIIRIEDTDILRNVKDGEASQLSNLKWLGVIPDESPQTPGEFGPYRQLERLKLYQKYAKQLLDLGLAYKDFKPESEKFAIRFKVPKDVSYSFDDMVRGRLTFLSKEVEDWIIIKNNGIPTYNFAVVVDDYLMQITHVLRGEEHITNTPKQLMIYEAFNWPKPIFGHMALIVNEQRKKLSKRDVNVIQFIEDYKKLGYLPKAMFNFIALLGYSPKSDDEILSSTDLIDGFDPKRLSSSPAMFDQKKLAYINSQYIKKLSIEGLIDLCLPFLKAANIEVKSPEWLKNLLALFKDRLVYGAQIVELYHEFFNNELKIGQEQLKILTDLDAKPLINLLMEKFSLIEFDLDSINNAIKQASLELNIKGRDLFMSIRIAIFGELHGPSLPHSIELLGKKVTISRLKETLNLLQGVQI